MKTSEYALIAKGLVLPVCIILSSSVSLAREAESGGGGGGSGNSGRGSSHESPSSENGRGRDSSRNEIETHRSGMETEHGTEVEVHRSGTETEIHRSDEAERGSEIEVHRSDSGIGIETRRPVSVTDDDRTAIRPKSQILRARDLQSISSAIDRIPESQRLDFLERVLEKIDAREANILKVGRSFTAKEVRKLALLSEIRDVVESKIDELTGTDTSEVDAIFGQ